ncbi:MAG: phosphate ABC transporter substrate-binding protein [Verrucomicrobiota bacterium]|nr:phosphate ABC transporter substrate-binding protein [Verrucomicrobiota bacterium]
MKSILASITLIGLAVTTLQAEKIVIKGSDTLGAKLVPQLAEQFRADNPGVSFEIAAEGSATGIAAVIDGTADIGMSSRNISKEEISKARLNGRDVYETCIGYDGIAVIVNENNPLSELSARQVERIFTGDVSDWSALRGNPGIISIYTRNTSSGTYSSFKELAMKKRDYASSSQKMAGNEQIAAEVAKNPLGIGYVGLAYAETPGVKVIKINGVLPSEDAIRALKYPYSRPLYLYTGSKAEGITAKFLDFSLSELGQKSVTKVHFIALDANSPKVSVPVKLIDEAKKSTEPLPAK